MKSLWELSLCSIFIFSFIAVPIYAATFTVDNLGDVDNGGPYTPGDGTNTLRKCIRLANTTAGSDIINFSVSGTISPASDLPEITDNGTIIDASSRWIGIWPGGQPGVVLDGSVAGNYAAGLIIKGASDCHILGMFIRNFGHSGIHIYNGAKDNIIGGTATRERNIISGNDEDGVSIGGTGTDGNKVTGNYIGTNVDGTAELGNGYSGVHIGDGAKDNIIGGTTTGERNIISGNDGQGVRISDIGTEGNKVTGNYIGTDVNGTAELENDAFGVYIRGGAKDNIIGGTTTGERNIISGNDGDGVIILYTGTEGNKVTGNYIGTDVNGTADLGNGDNGVYIGGGAKHNIIGGTTAGERNIISGNDGDGIGITDTGTDGNKVTGNYIGTDVNGAADLGNRWNGVIIFDEAKNNIIGGATESEGNTIAFNGASGVHVYGADTDYNRISYNSMYDNAGLGIDLDDGGNDDIPAPDLASAQLTGNMLTLSGAGAGADAIVEVFQVDSQASGEGKTYLGSLIADGSGDFSGDIDISGTSLSAGDYIVATTIHTDSNTSEFSIPVPVVIEPTSIIIMSPNGGEVWCSGSIQTISWATEGSAIARVHLQYSINSGVNYQDITTYPHLPNTGTCQWTVPQVSSTTVLVKAIGKDAGDNPLADDVSNANFTINLCNGDVLSISLYQGFNLFSVPFHPLDSDLDVALVGIMASMDSILALRDGQWKVSAPNPGGDGWAIDQVKTLDGAEAYVIYMKMENPVLLELAGTPLAPEDVPELLQQGFNLAPYNSTSVKTVEEAFASIRDDVDTFLKYNAAEGKWKACVPNPDDGWILKQFSVVEPGDGLVIYSLDDVPWDVNQ